MIASTIFGNANTKLSVTPKYTQILTAIKFLNAWEWSHDSESALNEAKVAVRSLKRRAVETIEPIWLMYVL